MDENTGNNTPAELQPSTANLPAAKDLKTKDKPKTREQKTINLSIAEFEHLEKIVSARMQAGITNDWNHFLRQCVDFSINLQAAGGKATFAVPDGVTPMLLNNAFFHDKINNIPVCK